MVKRLAAPAVYVMVVLIVGCNMNPVQPVTVKTVGCSVYGTAASPVDVSVQTDVEGSTTYSPITMPWEYYQFTYENSYSIQVTAAAAASTTSATTGSGPDPYGLGLYKVEDAGANFTNDAVRGDVITNDDTGDSSTIYGIESNTILYVYDEIFTSAPENYTIYTAHSVWLKTITIGEDGSQTERVDYQSTDVLDITVTP